MDESRISGAEEPSAISVRFATVAFHDNTSPLDVAKLMGHSSPSVPLNLYGNAVEEGQRRGAASVARSLGLGS